MSNLRSYVNDIIEQAYHDGVSGVRDHTEITYLTEEDVELLVIGELEAGHYDEWISGYVASCVDEPAPSPSNFHIGAPVRFNGFMADTGIREGIIASRSSEEARCWYVILGNKAIWCHPNELELI